MSGSCAHGSEHCIYCNEEPCSWPGCPSLTQAEPQQFCVVHLPQAVLKRAREILTHRIFEAAVPLPLKYQRVLVELERKIIEDLEGTA